MKPTAQQQTAIDAYLAGGNVTVEALAGTGKTTTLMMMAQAAPRRRAVYLAFNKTVADEAKRKFAGTGVDARTVHSLALAYVRSRHPHMYERIFNGPKVAWDNEWAKTLNIANLGITIQGDDEQELYVARRDVVRMVRRCVKRFLETPAANITEDVIREAICDYRVRVHSGADLHQGATAYANLVEQLLTLTEKAWADMLRPGGKLPATQSVYLKLWQLDAPLLPYEVAFVDESQDSDKLLLDVLLRQPNTLQVVAVGDRSQAIYGWRGATNSMDSFGGLHCPLTESWRFGPEIAAVANIMLGGFCGSELHLTGLGGPSTVGYGRGAPDAVLCRTNAGALLEALNYTSQGLRVGVANRQRASDMEALAKAALALAGGKSTDHPLLSGFETWRDVEAAARNPDEDPEAEIVLLVKLVKLVGGLHALLALITKLLNELHPQVQVGTVHLSKGLEWDKVKLGFDFPNPLSPRWLDCEEANLAYVGITRAKCHLDLGGLSWLAAESVASLRVRLEEIRESVNGKALAA